MFKRSLRWFIPLLVLVVLAFGFVVIPMVHTHAATAVSTHSASSDSGATPNVYWNYP